jgi:hypothetical protein
VAVHEDPLARGDCCPNEKNARNEKPAQVEVRVVLGGHDEVAHAGDPFFGVPAPRRAGGVCPTAGFRGREAHDFCDPVFSEKLPVARPAPPADENVRIDLRGGVAGRERGWGWGRE